MRGSLCVVGLILLFTTLKEGSALRHHARKESKKSTTLTLKKTYMNRKHKSLPSLKSDLAGGVYKRLCLSVCLLVLSPCQYSILSLTTKHATMSKDKIEEIKD